jgi:hypothetical protein
MGGDAAGIVFALKPNEPISFHAAVILGKRGRPKKEEEKGSVTTLIGRGSDYLTARIARDAQTKPHVKEVH